jgi:type 1 glutamine amidotransferase
LNAKNLNYFDAIMLYTQGEFRMTDEQKADLLAFVKEDGKGLLVAHSGIDFNTWEFHPDGKMSVKDDGRWPGIIQLMGGVFINHPWRQNVKVNVEDRDFPATRHFPKVVELEDEIYQMDQFSRDGVRVLMSLDVSTVDLKNPPLAPVIRKDLDFPLAWAKKDGNGRVFVSPLGHILSHWDRPDMQKMWLEAAKWVLKLTDGDATPTGPKKGASN